MYDELLSAVSLSQTKKGLNYQSFNSINALTSQAFSTNGVLFLILFGRPTVNAKFPRKYVHHSLLKAAYHCPLQKMVGIQFNIVKILRNYP